MADRKIEIVDEDGRITISQDVIGSIAQLAAQKVNGIAHSISVASGLKSFFGGEETSSEIKTELTEEGVHIEVEIIVEYGHPVHEVAHGIQVNIQKDVEELAGINVDGIDVYVKKVVPRYREQTDHVEVGKED